MKRSKMKKNNLLKREENDNLQILKGKLWKMY